MQFFLFIYSFFNSIFLTSNKNRSDPFLPTKRDINLRNQVNIRHTIASPVTMTPLHLHLRQQYLPWWWSTCSLNSGGEISFQFSIGRVESNILVVLPTIASSVFFFRQEWNAILSALLTKTWMAVSRLSSGRTCIFCKKISIWQYIFIL